MAKIDVMEPQDWAFLARYDEDSDKLNFNDATQLETPLSRDRIVNAGLADGAGFLTKMGLAYAKKVLAREKELQVGIPSETRTKINSKAILIQPPMKQWYVASHKGKKLVTNGEILYFGKPLSAMKAQKLDVQRLKHTIAECHKGEFVQIFPHTYQIEELGGTEAVWLSDAKQGLFIAVQAKLFDFLADRFKAGRFFGMGATLVVQVRVRNLGLKNDVAAFIMPLMPGPKSKLKEPQKREGWSEALHDTGVPIN